LQRPTLDSVSEEHLALKKNIDYRWSPQTTLF
jgi:hypothetical protein